MERAFFHFNKDNSFAYGSKETYAQSIRIERSLLKLRIHIVQKGDILYDIAKKYNVDFEDIVKMNPQLSSPDMIMPGMKIKIPTESKHVRSDGDKTERKDMRTSEEKMERIERPKSYTTERPMGDDIADDHGKKNQVQPEMPRDIGELYPVRPDFQPPKVPSHSNMGDVLSEEKRGKEGKAGEYVKGDYQKEKLVQPQTQYRPMQPPMPATMQQMGGQQSKI